MNVRSTARSFAEPIEAVPDTRYPSLAHWGAFSAVVREGRVVACEPFAADPQPSPLLRAMPGMVHSPLRVARPAVREGWLRHRDRLRGGSSRFVEVDWDTALDLVAGELTRVRTEHGAGGLLGGSYGWASAGRYHHARTQVRRFLFSGGGCVDQLSNYSWGAAHFLLPHVIGSHIPVTGKVTQWSSIIDHTRTLIAFGGLPLKNAQITSGGAGDHSMPGWLRQAAQAGIDVVAVSPDRRDAPAIARARWLGVRPNTDTAMMLGMAHTLATEGLHDRAFLARHCTGYERFEAYLLGQSDGTPKSAAWAAAICGLDTHIIQTLARQSAAGRTLITCAWSLQRADHGEQPFWMAITLAAMLGQIGLPGGGIAFAHASMNGAGYPRIDGLPTPEMSTGRNPAGLSIPVARLGDLLACPGQTYDFNGEQRVYPDVRMVYWAGGNPFHHHQDLNRLAALWQRPETVVVHEPWWTPVARHADIVLPATTTFERNDIGGSSRDRFLFAMHRAIAPVGGARNDVDIFGDLAARLGHEAHFREGRDESAWLRHLYDQTRSGAAAVGVTLPEFEAFWAKGHVELPLPQHEFVLFENFRRDPEAHPLATPSGRIEITSQAVAQFGYADCPAHPTWIEPLEWLGAVAAGRHPLHLVSSQPADKLHSQYDPGTVSSDIRIQGRTRLRMHPGDAAQRRLASGDLVRVFNDRGATIAAVVADESVREGVVILPTGAWFDPAGDGTLDRHGNPNVLTRDAGTSRLAQGSSAMSTLVEVERWVGEVPAVGVFEPPQILVV